MAKSDNQTNISNWKAVALLAAQSVVMVGLGVAIWWFSGRPLDSFISIHSRDIVIGLAIAGGLIAVAITIFFAAPDFRKSILLEQAENAPEFQQPFNAVQIVAISIGAGVGEEVLFRGGLQTLLGDYLPFPLAIATVSALFAVLHLQSRRIAVIIFAVGCIFGLAYYLSGSLLAVILGHTLYDIYALARSQQEMTRQGYYSKQGRSG